jgi:hypothetical protein
MKSNNLLKYYLHTVAILMVAAAFTACTKDNGGSGGVPEKAVVTGEAANECPVTSVVLTASAGGAQSYLWYRNTFAIAGATEATYAAISSGTYYAVGVNAAGKGEKSDDREVTIQLNCPPATPALTGETSNLCPALTVRLTASTEHVESYIWYKGATVIPGATAAFYDVRESGVYSVAAQNTYGASAKSVEKTVTISACPPAPPTISGSNLNVCPGATVVLTAASEGADAYQWYYYGVLIPGATASTYEATTTGAYYATAKNTLGESEKTNAYMVYIDLCADNYTYADLLGTYNATGAPCMWGAPDTPGAPAWTCTITQPAGAGTGEYEIKPFSGARTGETDDGLLSIYLKVGQSEDGSKVGFGVDTERALGTETDTDKNTGLPVTYTAYFQAFFTRTISSSDGNKREIHWFSDPVSQVFWDPATKTLDFSGVYNWEGDDYDIIVAIVAFTDIADKKWQGSFSDGYKHCKFVQAGASGAPAGAFTGERVSLPRFNSRNGETLPITSVTTKFDPAKFSRK